LNKLKVTIVFSLLFLSAVNATEVNVDRNKPNQVKFISEAPTERVEGITDKIDGYALWDGDELINKSEFYFEVDLTSLDTGMGLRNRHMRDNYLHTDDFPYAEYAGKITKIEKVAGNDTWHVTTNGKLKIHGIEKDVVIEGTVSGEGDSYHVKSAFSVKLTDYKIKVPKLMFMKLNETIKLQVEFYAKEIKK